jgi:hypothetical protein
MGSNLTLIMTPYYFRLIKMEAVLLLLWRIHV